MLEYRRRQEQQAQIIRRFAEGRSQLAALYREALPISERRARKQHTLEDTTASVRELEKQLGVRTGYDAWLDSGLNNAHLASIATYFDCVPGFERLLAEHGNDLNAYYAAVRALARAPLSERAALCERRPAS